MSRIKIKIPDSFIYSTEIPVRINDLNYGGHVGNDSFLSIIHEARVRFLKSLNYSELEIEGAGIIMVDSLINYIRESLYGDILKIEIAVENIDERGCDFYYRIIELNSNKIIVIAKTGILFFDYSNKKKAYTPKKFIDKIHELQNSIKL